jgi:hypothetical protein
MKYRLYILSIIVIVTFATGIGHAATSSLSTTGAASGVAVDKTCIFYGVLIVPDGTNDVTVKVWGNTAASGLVLIDTYTVKGSGGPHAVGFMPGVDRVNGSIISGVYVSISVAGGGTCTWKVQYDQ